MATIGEIVDGLGVEPLELTAGQLPESVVVLLKVVDAAGGVSLRSSWSDGLSWIERRGFLEAAVDLERGEIEEEDD